MMQRVRSCSHFARVVCRSINVKFYSRMFHLQPIPVRHASSKCLNTASSQLLSHKSTRSFSTRCVSIDDVVQNHKSRILSFFIHDAAGKQEKFDLPYSWLRDVCQCPDCFNTHTLSRKQLMRNFDPDCTPQEVLIQPRSNELYVVWNDGHKSSYPLDFLRKRNFTKEGELLRQELHQLPQRIPWGPGLLGKIRSFTFQNLIESDQSLLEFMESVCIYGLVLIKDSPKMQINFLLLEWPTRRGYIMVTNFQLFLKPNPNNLAYTSDCLGHHKDLPYYELPPGIQLLNCISQDDKIIGGENQFADGYHCSQIVKQIDQYYYDLLCTQLIDYNNYGSDYLEEFHLKQLKPTIEVDRNGKFYRINYSDIVRDTYFNVPIETVDSLYRALKLFDDTARSHSVHHKLKPGEIVVLDNHRALHARSAYEVTGQFDRHLHGWYWRWDEFYSRMRKTTGKSLI